MADSEDRSSPPTPDRPAIDRWIAEGRYAEAAQALRAQGELALAQDLFERTWDYPSALALAKARGELVAQIRLALLSGELATLYELRPAVRAASPQVQLAVAATLEQHQQLALAAEVYEEAGELARAQHLYDQAGQHVASAKLYERQGDLVAAAQAYELVLAEGSLADPSHQTQAHRGLGRILQQLGRHEDAVRQLQHARAGLHNSPPDEIDPRALDEVEIGLVRALDALGYALVAHPIVLAYTGRHSDEPAVQTTAEFVARHAAPTEASVDKTDRQPPMVVLGRYQLTRLLGSGGMGRVYLASDRLTGRAVALKLLPARGVAAAPAQARPGSPADLWSRFVREAELLRGLRHPGIVQLVDFHPEAGAQVMEYLPGGSLAQRPLPLSPFAVRRVLLQVLAGLAAAHAAGVLHRDIKPHNLLVSATGDIRLGDFGAAYLQGLGATRTESFIGTLAYMAPEQLGGQSLSFATDLYALGVTAFQLLTGRLPFPGPDFIAQHLHDPPPDPRRYVPTLGADFAAVLDKALQKAPKDRYASVEEMRHAVQALAVDGDGAPAGQVQVPGDDVVPPKTALPRDQGVTLEGASPILQTPHSTVAIGLDVRLGRPVLVERFDIEDLTADAFSAHLRWLRGIARLAGPGLQRVLRIDEAAAEVHYEVPIGPQAGPELPLARADANLIHRALRRLHAADLTHGAVLTSVVCEPTAAMLLVHGRGPLGWSGATPPAPEADLAALAELASPYPTERSRR